MFCICSKQVMSPIPVAASDENGHACIRERLPPVEVDACVSQRGGRFCVLRHLVPEVKLTSSGGGC